MLRVFFDKNLSKSEAAEIAALLKRQDPRIENDLDQMWYLLDLVWDDHGCDNQRLDWEKISTYYAHPVWLLNGLFIEQDAESTLHRKSIAAYINSIGATEVVDYGGGFGTLARTISEHNAHTRVYIYEPFPSEYGLKRISEHPNITVIDRLKPNTECLVSTDVLEHLDDPLKVLGEMTGSVQVGGTILIAAPFSPMIKCHLPKHFHFRYTFSAFCRLMGLRKTGTLPDAPHVSVYIREKDIHPDRRTINALVGASKMLFAATGLIRPAARLFAR